MYTVEGEGERDEKEHRRKNVSGKSSDIQKNGIERTHAKTERNKEKQRRTQGIRGDGNLVDDAPEKSQNRMIDLCIVRVVRFQYVQVILDDIFAYVCVRERKLEARERERARVIRVAVRGREE